MTDPEAISSETDTALDTFLHVADLHFWKVVFNPFRLLNKRALGNLNVWLRRRNEFPMAEAERLIDGLDATGERQLVLTGDFASTALDEEFARARSFVDTLVQRGFALHLMPGNHDVYTFESVRQHRFERHFAPYVPEQGYPAMTTLAGGTPLLLVPTVCPNVISSKGRIAPAALEAVARLLKHTASPLVVAGHYPLLDETPGYTLTPGRRMRNADRLRKILGNCGATVLYVAGHVHRFSFVRDPQYSTLHHLCTGAFFRVNHREDITGEFSRVTVYPDRFDVHRHVHRDTWSLAHAAPDRMA